MSHRDVMLDLVQTHHWTRGAELGVSSGHLLSLLLRKCPDLFLIGVDRMVIPDRAARLRELVAIYRDRCVLHECLTTQAAELVPDHSLDFVFIDADHHYAAVCDDIARWRNKVRPGGWLTGHDYNRGAFPGVIQAVDEAFSERVQAYPWHVWAVEM